MKTAEQSARQEIDRLLAAGGWPVQDIRRADLRGALFVTRSQLDAATGDATTLLSSQLAPPAHW